MGGGEERQTLCRHLREREMGEEERKGWGGDLSGKTGLYRQIRS